MTQSTKTKLMKVLNNQAIIARLDYLKSRWTDEHQYEDWKDYSDEIAKSFAEAGHTAVKITKRPFGAHIVINNTTWHTFVKNKGANQICFAARPVK